MTLTEAISNANAILDHGGGIAYPSMAAAGHVRLTIRNLVDAIAAAPPDPRIADYAKALSQIKSIQLGPDRGSGQWQSDTCVEIATDALNGKEIAPDSKDERDMLQLIDQRDMAEECINDIYFMMTGRSPEWSNLFGYGEALDELTVARQLLGDAAKAPDPRIAELNGTIEQKIHEIAIANENEKTCLRRISELEKQNAMLLEALDALYQCCIHRPLNSRNEPMAPGLSTQGWKERDALEKARAALASAGPVAKE
jgi:hypothetical protein